MNEYLLVICLSTVDAERARSEYSQQHSDEVESKPANSLVLTNDRRVDFVSINSKAAFDGRRPRDFVFTKYALAKSSPERIYELVKQLQLATALSEG